MCKNALFSCNYTNHLTGDVIPVGGMMQSNDGHNAFLPMVMGDKFVEPLGNRPVRIGGARVTEYDAVPSSGGYQTLLDAGVMSSEITAMEAVRMFMETITGGID